LSKGCRCGYYIRKTIL